MNLSETINQFDGENIDPLRDFAVSVEPTDIIVSELLVIVKSGKPIQQTAATWILKRWSESGFQPTAQQTIDLLNSLPDFEDWGAVLHALQILPKLTIPVTSAMPLYCFLKHQLTHENKFVRAWAYNGLDVLARQFPECREETEQLLQLALRDEPASVQARIRQIYRARTR